MYVMINTNMDYLLFGTSCSSKIRVFCHYNNSLRHAKPKSLHLLRFNKLNFNCCLNFKLNNLIVE